MAKRAYRNAPETTPRHLWLAALGAVSVARREALTAASIALEEAVRLGANARQFASDAGDVALGVAATVQERVEPRLEAVGAALAERLGPLFRHAGATARPASKRTRRAPRKQAASPRSAAARRKAATRVASKGRG